jgi:hypothetical protein
MSTWRPTAIELFPHLERELRGRRAGYTIYSLLGDLRIDAEKAHSRGDEDLLRRIYGFAEWCSRQRAEELWNAAGVAFYEHLFENPTTIDRVLPWLSAYAIRKHWDLWSVWYEERWDQIRPLLEARLQVAERDPGPEPSWNWG